MTYTITFVAAHSDLKAESLNIVGDYKNLTWLSPHKAAQLDVQHAPNAAAITYIRNQLAPYAIDVFVCPSINQRKKLLLADMDSTIVTGETLDDLAAFAGIKDQIAAITARAMNGELDFHDAIRERVALIKDLPTEFLSKTLAETKLTDGAYVFVNTMKKHGAFCVLVSGGFTFFTENIAEQCGFHVNHGNILGIADNKLTGEVVSPILDKTSKFDFLNRYASQQNIALGDTVAIGDGANDLPMLQAAGLGLGFYAKPAVEAELTNFIRFNDLTAALYAQGYSDDEFVIEA